MLRDQFLRIRVYSSEVFCNFLIDTNVTTLCAIHNHPFTTDRTIFYYAMVDGLPFDRWFQVLIRLR